MNRTIDNCSLIKVNLKAGRNIPNHSDKHCEGYIRRDRIHPTCSKCKLHKSKD